MVIRDGLEERSNLDGTKGVGAKWNMLLCSRSTRCEYEWQIEMEIYIGF